MVLTLSDIAPNANDRARLRCLKFNQMGKEGETNHWVRPSTLLLTGLFLKRRGKRIPVLQYQIENSINESGGYFPLMFKALFDSLERILPAPCPWTSPASSGPIFDISARQSHRTSKFVRGTAQIYPPRGFLKYPRRVMRLSGRHSAIALVTLPPNNKNAIACIKGHS